MKRSEQVEAKANNVKYAVFPRCCRCQGTSQQLRHA